MPQTWRGLVGEARFLGAAARDALRAFQEGENLRLRAMALTYITLFALAPALVVVFSAVQAVTGGEAISRALNELLLENLAVGAREAVQEHLGRFVARQRAASAGLVGGVILVLSAAGLFGHVERAINDIWRVRRRRSWVHQMLTYWAALTLGPLLLVGSISLGHLAKKWIGESAIEGMLIRLGITGATCLFFTVIYLITPNTRVRLRFAVAGGVVSGIGWEIAKWAYTLLVAKFFHYHAVYGSVAALPIFLIWLYVSWTLLLFGARLAYLLQNAGILRRRRQHLTLRARELLSARALLEIARAFYRGSQPIQIHQLGSRLAIAEDLADDALAPLRGAALVAQAAGGGLLPGRALATITLADVRAAVVGGEPPLPEEEGARLLAELLGTADGRAMEGLGEVTLQSLCERLEVREAPEGASGRVERPAGTPA
jgi:membrane protein